ncbi:MAG: TIGR00725 family protein [Actinomycetota bacterium]
MNDPAYVAVIGAGLSSAEIDSLAEEVGVLLARNDAIVVCGGLGGVMEAACRGAKSARGTTIGILPGAERADANEFCDVVIPTGLGEARNTVIVRSADAVIAVDGEFGTLSEIGFALKIGKPVVGLGTWELSRGGDLSSAVKPAATPAEAVNLALSLIPRP